MRTIESGQLRLGAFAGGAAGSDWFNATDGIIYGPMIAGDCLMRARMIGRNYAGDGPIPLSEFRIAGISAHDPAQPPFNYCHLGLGVLVPEVGATYRIESKSNRDSVSDYITQDWPGDVYSEVALQRVGQIFTYAARLDPSDAFTITRIIDRAVDGPLLPQELWWGLMTYSNELITDTSATYDWVDFSTPGFNGGLILPTS